MQTNYLSMIPVRGGGGGGGGGAPGNYLKFRFNNLKFRLNRILASLKALFVRWRCIKVAHHIRFNVNHVYVLM